MRRARNCYSATIGRTKRFWDFKACPEQIPLVLEDFRPWSRYVAILTFYELLKWLNGNQSIFETNDCGLRPPRPDSEAPDFIRPLFANDPVVLHGRLTLFCRDLAWNVSAPTVDGLKRSIHDGLRDNVPLFPAVVMVGEWRHFFIAINRPGRAEIRYEPHWLGMDIGYDTAHIEIESIAPERAHLPITEIGYRSHFTSPDSVAAYGGPVAFVEAWLETESQAPDWRCNEQERRQFTLF